MTANFRAEPHTGAVKVKGTSEVVASRESFGSLNSDKCSRLGAVELLVTMAMWALNVAGGIFSIVSIFLTKSCVVKVALFRTSVLSPPAERAHTAPVTCGSLVRLFFFTLRERTPRGSSASMYWDHSQHNYCQILCLHYTTVISLTTRVSAWMSVFLCV